jgi:hypothetical protein
MILKKANVNVSTKSTLYHNKSNVFESIHKKGGKVLLFHTDNVEKSMYGKLLKYSRNIFLYNHGSYHSGTSENIYG